MPGGGRKKGQPSQSRDARARARKATFIRELQRAMSLAASANVIAAPVSHSQLLEMIVSTASQVIDARAGSLCLLDESSQELIFEVVLGEKSEEFRKIKVPVGHGIVGLVAATGQAIATSDVRADTRHASDVAERVGYMPENILAVPLFYADRVIGVLELLDKNGQESFGAADMQILGLFASLAAIAIQQARAQTSITSMLMQMLSAFRPVASGSQRRLEKAAAAVAQDIDSDHRQAMEISELIHEIMQYGRGESTTCRALLEDFLGYLRSRSSSRLRRASLPGTVRGV